MESLDACAQATLEPGDAIIIKTPTGGGFGESEPSS
jgi:N-methylhydantoinase B/oxoprolinase/acetone carboxylase alpha subunit